MGFKRVIYDRRAGGDMEVFLLEQWFKDRDKSGLKYE